MTRIKSGRIRFDRYVLDMDRGCVFQDEAEIALRPKAFAVLLYLTENAGRLVTKDELFDAVWPGVTVTDDAQVQTVGELRRALGEDGPRLIKTVPRRGYRFEAAVAVVVPSGSCTADEAHAESPGVPYRAGVLASTPELTGAWGLRSAKLRILLVVLVLSGLLATLAMWMRPGPERLAATAERNGFKTVPDPEFGAKPAIAILPFLDHEADAVRERFADGLTQDLINAIGRFSAITVLSWNAVLPYKGKPASPQLIARELAVRYQIEGSVQRSTDRARVLVQLVDREGRVLWAARFDEALADVFVLQGKITTGIAEALTIRLAEIERRRAFAVPTGSLQAYDYVLRARPASQRPTRANNAEARALLRRAIDLDPNYAAAYAALAEIDYVAVSLGWAERPAAFLDRAEALALKALSLDRAEVRSHIVLGRIHMLNQRYQQAQTEIDRAIGINPNDAQGIAGRGNIMVWLGQTDAAVELLERALRIDPELSAIDRFALALAYYLKERYAEAIEQAEINLRTAADASFSRVLLAAAYAQIDRTEDVARIVPAVRRSDPSFDPQEFGSKFLSPANLAHLREGFRKAGLSAPGASKPDN